MRRHLGTALLLIPLVLFLAVTLVIPVCLMVVESVRDSEAARLLPRTLASLEGWNGAAPVPTAAYEALVQDFAATPVSQWGPAASRLNIEFPGARSLVLSTLRALAMAEDSGGDPQSRLIAQDPRWAEPRIWQAIWAARGPWTDRFLLAALDLKRGENGMITEDKQSIYRAIYIRTFGIALTVTALCLALGLPIAVYLASLPPQKAMPLLLLLMLPLWTSVLVRAMAWILLLQNNGLVNQALMGLHITTAPIQLVFNRIGVLIAMTHVLLPFMILPIYNVMRVIPRNQLRAAGSLGATPWVVFRRVYLPQSRAGIAAGCILVFASASGYYITPALVGGGADQMLGTFVELAAIRYSNQSLAAALGVIFMVIFLSAIGALFAWLRPMRAATGGLKG
ncbi:ABC transporter permease [Rhodoligotrophos defluvii]|uniref:ABC transporter permease n=1 Tax=Rhodoligotrophos defluvii TaxID=2561934 RepID=UPI0010C938A3|nr:ABC transporter permease [Rhodoligotrophos defluvii]